MKPFQPSESDLRVNRREPITRHVRQAVLDRDGGECVACGSDVNLHIDHIWPVALGGGSEMSNLQTLCRVCNLRKSANPGPPPLRTAEEVGLDRLHYLEYAAKMAQRNLYAAINAPVAPISHDPVALKRWHENLRNAGEAREAAWNALAEEWLA